MTNSTSSGHENGPPTARKNFLWTIVILIAVAVVVVVLEYASPQADPEIPSAPYPDPIQVMINKSATLTDENGQELFYGNEAVVVSKGCQVSLDWQRSGQARLVIHQSHPSINDGQEAIIRGWVPGDVVTFGIPAAPTEVITSTQGVAP